MRDALAETTYEMLARLRNNASCTVVITGEPGAGKSTLAINIGAMAALLTDQHWDWKAAITFDGVGYLKALEELPQYSVVILNEAGEALFNREWQSAEGKNISKTQLTDRVKRKIKIFIIPYNSMLDINIQRSANYFLFCYLRGSRRYTDIYTGKPASNPFVSTSLPFFEKTTAAYGFAKLPSSIYQEYITMDTAAKEDMNAKYQEALGPQASKKHKKNGMQEPPINLHLDSLTELAREHKVSRRTVVNWRRKWPEQPTT